MTSSARVLGIYGKHHTDGSVFDKGKLVLTKRPAKQRRQTRGVQTEQNRHGAEQTAYTGNIVLPMPDTSSLCGVLL